MRRLDPSFAFIAGRGETHCEQAFNVPFERVSL